MLLKLKPKVGLSQLRGHHWFVYYHFKVSLYFGLHLLVFCFFLLRRDISILWREGDTREVILIGSDWETQGQAAVMMCQSQGSHDLKLTRLCHQFYPYSTETINSSICYWGSKSSEKWARFRMSLHTIFFLKPLKSPPATLFRPRRFGHILYGWWFIFNR